MSRLSGVIFPSHLKGINCQSSPPQWLRWLDRGTVGMLRCTTKESTRISATKGIKSKWKTDKVLKYKRCYIQVVKGKRYRKDFLGMQAITGVSYQDAPVESDTTINFLNQPITGRFDSFLFMIRVENYALICMSNNGRHFSNFRTIEHCKVNGVGGFLSVKGVEIIFWWIEDDKGVSNTIKIKCALYVPSLPIFFLCAQHWIQQANDHFPSKRGTWCA